MTVSWALRNSPEVSESTRRRVAEAAAQMGYQMNPYVRGFVNSRRRRGAAPRMPIALLNLLRPPSLWQKESWCRDLHQGCVKRAEELGYYIEEIQLRASGMNAKRAGLILRSRGIRGVIVAPSPSAFAHLRLDWEHVAAVAIGMTLKRPELNRVASNNSMAMRLVLHHLNRARYRRIGLLMNQEFGKRSDGDLEGAFHYYQSRLSAKDRIPIHSCAWHNYSHGLADWLKVHRPDVVITYWPGVYDWLVKAGYSIPADIGFVHLDSGEQTHKQLGVQPSGTNVRNHEIGAKAVELIISLLERNECGIPNAPAIITVPPVWIPGKTIRSAR